MSAIGSARPVGRSRTATLTMAALGVVFGDIGTSPLYTVKECFSEFTGLQPVHEDVLGILSLITWALIVIVTVKYVMVVMRADNHGEGGVLALMALVSRRAEISPRRRNLYLMLGMAGAALFYGDCLLTPADLGAERHRGPERRDAGLRAAGRADRARRAGRRCSPCSASARPASAAGSGRSRCVWFIAILVLGAAQIVEHAAGAGRAVAAACASSS